MRHVWPARSAPMKKRYEDWYKLTGDTTSKPANNVSEPIRVLDLPGFQEIEDKLWIYAPKHGVLTPEIESLINDLSVRTFGITAKDTFFEWPENYSRLPEGSDERTKIENRYENHCAQYDTSEATDDEAMESLLTVGLDFGDATGQPLRCTLHFCRQAEAAVKGIKGKMPDRAVVGLESWNRKLEREARKHVRKKRSA